MSGPLVQAGSCLLALMEFAGKVLICKSNTWFIFPIGFSSPRSNLLAIMQHLLALLEEVVNVLNRRV